MPETTPFLAAQTVLLEGPDAGSFLHGQLTSNVLGLRAGEWQFSGWLDAQGRVRALFHLARLAEGRWVLIPRGGNAADLATELARFVFRARVSLKALEFGTFRIGPAAELHLAAETEGQLRLGCGDHQMLGGGHVTADDGLRLAQIRRGWPWLPAGALGQYTAASLALHHLAAVALDKGCYPGQEIVARLHYRGGNKRRLCRVILSHDVGADAQLQRIDDGANLHVLDVVPEGTGYHALAVVHDSWLADRRDASAMSCTDGTSVRVVESWDA